MPLSACHPVSTRMLCCRSATLWAGLGRFVVLRSPMSPIRIDRVSLIGICSDPEHPSFPKRLAAQFASLGYRRVRSGRAHWLSNSYRSQARQFALRTPVSRTSLVSSSAPPGV